MLYDGDVQTKRFLNPSINNGNTLCQPKGKSYDILDKCFSRNKTSMNWWVIDD